MLQKYSSYILCFLIVLLIVALYANNFSPLARLEWKLQDLLYSIKGGNQLYQDMVQINIDDRTLDEYGAWPWPRDRIADLLAAIGQGNPKTVLLDLPLEEDISHDTAGLTEIMAGQMSWMKNVIIPYEYSPAEYIHGKISNPKYLYNYSVTINNELGTMDEKASLLAHKIFLPPEPICQYAAGLGFRANIFDHDRKIRWEPLVLHFEGYYYPSAALLTAANYKGIPASAVKIYESQYVQMGGLEIPTDDKGRLFINYNKPSESFVKISAKDILNEKYGVSKLAGKLIILGLSSSRHADYFKTPVTDRMLASEKTANVVENIIHANFMERMDASPGLGIIILLVFGGIFSFILPRVSFKFRAIILLASFVVFANICYIIFNSMNLLPQPLYLNLMLLMLFIASPLLDRDFLSRLMAFRIGFEPSPDSIKTPKVDLPPSRVITSEPTKRVTKEEAFETEFLPTPAGGKSDMPTAINSKDATAAGSSEISETHTVSGNSDKPVGVDTGAKDDFPLEYNPPSEVVKEAEAQELHMTEEKVLPSEQPGTIEKTLGFNGDISGIKNLGRYKVLGILGKGAMGTVYKGIDPAIDRYVALKTIRLDFVNDPTELAELKERLSREAKAAGILSHPNIVTIYDVGSEGNLQYIAMEYLEGQTLEDMIRRKVKFNYKIIAQIITQICTALDYAHNQGIVHRDIKPANIMVLNDYRVKVMDFGIARVDSSSMTRTGIAMGTPNYISPEQLQGKSVDRRCDLFSLGVVMYEMLLHRRPFRGENLTSLIYSIINTDPELPSSIDSSMPHLFDRVIEKALKKNPDERFQHASEISAALSDFIEAFVVRK